MHVGAVIVTHESGDVVGGLVESLRTHEPAVEVVIVDAVTPHGPPTVSGVEVLVLDENRGYGAACNRGARVLAARGCDAIVFLNPDVRLQGPSLSQLAQPLETLERTGVATGPMVNAAGEPMPSAWGPTSIRRALTFAAGYEAGRLRAAAGGALRRSLPSLGPRSNGVRVEGHVLGAAMMVRTTCFEDLQGFDESFFLYWEDADLCHRARQAGWEVRVLPCTPFVNSGDTGPAPVTDEQRWEWFADGAVRFGHKHLVPGRAMQLEAALSLGRRLGRLRERG